MVEDTKMEDTTTADAPEKDSSTTTTPPLEAAARRLERLLGGGSTSTSSSKASASSDQERQIYTYGNPVKVARRWLGTASGASGKATSEGIVAAATSLLDPSHGDD